MRAMVIFFGVTDWHRVTLNCFVELATFDQVHAEVTTIVALADFVNWNDEWMVQPGRCLGFAAEAP